MTPRAMAVGITIYGLFLALSPAESGTSGPSNAVRSAVAGEIAETLCAGVFISQQDARDVNEEVVATAMGSPKMPFTTDKHNRYVTVKFESTSPPRIAAYREGLGCRILPPLAEPSQIASYLKRFDDAAAVASNRIVVDDKPWPAGDAPLTKQEQRNLDVSSLGKVLARAFDGESYGSDALTHGIVIVRDGRLVAERYRPGFTKDTPTRTWSSAKSITGSLIGVALQQRILNNINTPAPIVEWRAQNDPRGKITLADLLHMSSGLSNPDPADGSDTPLAYSGGIDIGLASVDRHLLHEPGKTWFYANYDTLALMRVLHETLGDDHRYLQFPYVELFNRIGMNHTIAETDIYGNYILSSMVYTTPRDFARLALLHIRDGVWIDGSQLMPKGWASFMCTKAPASESETENKMSLTYGAQMWIASPDETYGVKYRACAMLGYAGQYVFIIPELKLIVVRKGADASTGKGWNSALFLSDVLHAISLDKS